MRDASVVSAASLHREARSETGPKGRKQTFERGRAKMTATPRQYSGFIATRYDQPEPVGELGRGAHYSIFETGPIRADPRDPTFIASQQICLVWDEDHDIRVIHVLERLLFEGLLVPILFIGERKGALVVYVSDLRAWGIDPLDYHRRVARVAESLADPWTVSVYTYPNPVGLGDLIDDEPELVLPYLEGIAAIWALGSTPIIPDATTNRRPEKPA
jgi:hypothetical protein